MISEKLSSILTTLRGEGLRADVDPRNLTAPCIWVSPRAITDWTLCQPETQLDIVLIAPDNGIPTAIRTLETLLEKSIPALQSLGAGIDHVALNETVTLSGVGSPLPAFRIETTL